MLGRFDDAGSGDGNARVAKRLRDGRAFFWRIFFEGSVGTVNRDETNLELLERSDDAGDWKVAE